MSVLLWWSLPLLATLAAVCWAAWVRRTPRRPGDADSIAEYARFRAALARSTGPPTGEPPRQSRR